MNYMFGRTAHNFVLTPRAVQLLCMAREYGPERVDCMLLSLFCGVEPGAYCSRCGMTAEEIWSVCGVSSGCEQPAFDLVGSCIPRSSVAQAMRSVTPVVLFDDLAKEAAALGHRLEEIKQRYAREFTDTYMQLLER